MMKGGGTEYVASGPGRPIVESPNGTFLKEKLFTPLDGKMYERRASVSQRAAEFVMAGWTACGGCRSVRQKSALQFRYAFENSSPASL
ncbi:hypothetical protein SLE2022_089540 [Rubroshorea leprosula]